MGLLNPQFLSTLWTITQQTVALGASGTFANSNNVCTLTFTAAHGLTQSPAAGVPANWFVSFSGASAQTGVGTLNGNYFRILSVPTTTTITIYSTVTAATVTSATAIPVFFPNFDALPLSGLSGAGPGPNLTGNPFHAILGANCEYFWNTDGTLVLLDQFTTTQLGGTPSTAPATKVVTSGGPFFKGSGPGAFGLQCLGASGTTYAQVLAS
jgi:hypothetical protein